MDIIELVHNTALLIALLALYQILISRRLPHSRGGQVMFGLLFGLTAIIGMLEPLVHSPGIIFDGRSIVMAIAGYIGGPLVAAISALTAGLFRLWLGGGGAPVGIAVTLISGAIGVVFFYVKKRRGGPLGALLLFGFGLLVQLVMLALYTQLPGKADWQVINSIGANILLFYPLATMLIALLFQDYEEQERNKQMLHQLAYRDPISGLPNRSALLAELKRCLDRDGEGQQQQALCLLNIDRFKRLNDARGHVIGDALLHAVGMRLFPLLGNDALLVRLSADEFACLLKSGASEGRIRELTTAIHDAFSRPLHVGADEFDLTVSVGVTTLPQGDNDEPGEVMRRADTALHHAKRGGGNQSVHFAPAMAEHAENQLQLERELRHAIDAGQLRLFLHSQLSGDGRIVGAEALVRWQHPLRGVIPPGLFIPLAEESDLIVMIDIWMFNETCRLLSSPPLADNDIHISVNISPRHFYQPGFSGWVRDTLASHGVDPRRLTLEITEGLLIEDLNATAAKMQELSALGLRFSVDDFGTGYSSLAYLKQLPIHELKIDKVFIQDAPNDPTLVESILAVAKHMHLDVVAEGVETAAQADLLKTRHRVYQQGYLYGKPAPAAEWLQRLPHNRT